MVSKVIVNGKEYSAVRVTIVNEKREKIVIVDEIPGVMAFDPKVMDQIRKSQETSSKKWQNENPCPNCGSTNVDVDWGTPITCLDCGHKWG